MASSANTCVHLLASPDPFVRSVADLCHAKQGAATALQVFNSRILPFLPLPQELRGPAVQLAKAHGDLSATAQEANDEQAEGVKEE